MNNPNLNQIELTEEEKPTSLAFGLSLYKAYKLAFSQIINFSNPYSFAKFFCDYIKELEKMKKEIKDHLESNNIPSGLSINLYNQMIIALDTIKKISFEEIKPIYERKFNESFYTYINEEGKMKSVFGAMRDSFNNR